MAMDDAKKKKNYSLRSKYGITLAVYNALLVAQEYRCAICGFRHNENNRQAILNVDHCHDKKIIRGLLCNSCNVGLGHFRDDPKRLTEAIKYLEEDGATRHEPCDNKD